MNHNNTNKSGCNQIATKSIDKTAAKLGYGLKKSTTIKVWSIKNILFAAILMIELMQLIQPAMTMTIQQHNQQKKNLLEFSLGNFEQNVGGHQLVKYRKKHSAGAHPSTNKLDLPPDVDPWVNPCGGKADGSGYTSPISSSSRIVAWRQLRRRIKHEYTLQYLFNNPEILKELDLHHKSYKFLKIVNRKMNRVALRSWHKHAQIYVGAFYYLYNIERLNQKKDSVKKTEPTTEIEHLYLSATNVLCNIEEAINDTRFNPNIKTYSRAEMNRILKFQSVTEVHENDLKFVKARYFKSLTGMLGTLQHKIKEYRYCGPKDVSTSSSSATIESDDVSQNLLHNEINDSSSYSASQFVLDRRNAIKCEEIRKRRPKFTSNKRRKQQNESAQRETISWI